MRRRIRQRPAALPLAMGRREPHQCGNAFLWRIVDDPSLNARRTPSEGRVFSLLFHQVVEPTKTRLTDAAESSPRVSTLRFPRDFTRSFFSMMPATNPGFRHQLPGVVHVQRASRSLIRGVVAIPELVYGARAGMKELRLLLPALDPAWLKSSGVSLSCATSCRLVDCSWLLALGAGPTWPTVVYLFFTS